MAHKDQPAELMEQAKEELIKAKLDGCVHKCGLCGNKYNSIKTSQGTSRMCTAWAELSTRLSRGEVKCEDCEAGGLRRGWRAGAQFLLNPDSQTKCLIGTTTKSPGGAGGLNRKRVRKGKS